MFIINKNYRWGGVGLFTLLENWKRLDVTVVENSQTTQQGADVDVTVAALTCK